MKFVEQFLKLHSFIMSAGRLSWNLEDETLCDKRKAASRSVASAGCSPAMGKKLIRLGCAGPSTDSSSYELAHSVDHIQDIVQMSPHSRRHRLWKLFATITPIRRAKVLKSFESDDGKEFHADALDFQKAVADVNASTDLNYVTLLLKIRLKEGIGLAIRDASGSSDPYVKFRYKDKVVYKSLTVFKCLNPMWEEEFQMLVDDMTTNIRLEVYDYDRFCTDDFMGGASIDISRVKWFTPYETTLTLQDDNNPSENLGMISLSVTITPLTAQEQENFLQKSNRGILTETQKKKEKLVQMWSSVVNIVLVEGKGLSINYNMTQPPDPCCKFKLGCEKYKSKACNRTCDPKWIEQFDLHIYEHGSDKLEVMCHDKKTNSAIGRTCVDLSQLPRDQTVQKWYDLEEMAGSILLLITVSGSQSNDSVVDLTEFSQNDVRNAIIGKYNLTSAFNNLKDIGTLTVKVFRAENLQSKDLGGKSDPFAVLELVNARLQTHTEYKTLHPQWNKLFTFNVKDIHTCLEVTIYDEDPNNKFEFLGKVSIPLMSIRNCERRWFALKDKKLQQRVKGEVLLELDVIWNPIRAAVRTFNPREKKYIEQEPKFKASIFRSTVMELKEFALSIIEMKDYLQSCFDWESTPRSLIAFLIFMFFTYYVQLYHLPILLLLLFARCLLYRNVSNHISRSISLNKVEEIAEDSKTTTSLRDTLSSVQETLSVVQNLLVFISTLLQRIKNTFNFTNSWLSWLAVIVLSFATLLLYFIPLRTLVMIWGVNKFSKKLINPHYIDNNELLDFLSRIPSDSDLNDWRDILVERSDALRDRKSRQSS
ncbi:unnamed protein product [Auanema sp. JU1783]|nr:unnamed protein product [Auanema sp. JU1783]